MQQRDADRMVGGGGGGGAGGAAKGRGKRVRRSDLRACLGDLEVVGPRPQATGSEHDIGQETNKKRAR